MSIDDFFVISEGLQTYFYIFILLKIFLEYKRMNLRGGISTSRGNDKVGPAGKCKMPIRNDGFRKTLSPDPKSKINQGFFFY